MTDGSLRPKGNVCVGIEIGDAGVLTTLADQSGEVNRTLGQLVADWPRLVGARLPLRILRTDGQYPWSATLVPGAADAGGLRGHGGALGGTLDRTSFDVGGTAYAVDLLAADAGGRLRFSTTPDPPEGLRLVVPGRAAGCRAFGPVARATPCRPASIRSSRSTAARPRTTNGTSGTRAGRAPGSGPARTAGTASGSC